ncbi:hypothetical protein U6G28_10845 [Actinomycetaceae bacterium MB13-C1-2]|nr:hypothetical protein U6G28_10845 [Actinomycetaceae bacterium MB13-C1-2]
MKSDKLGLDAFIAGMAELTADGQDGSSPALPGRMEPMKTSQAHGGRSREGHLVVS